MTGSYSGTSDAAILTVNATASSEPLPPEPPPPEPPVPEPSTLGNFLSPPLLTLPIGATTLSGLIFLLLFYRSGIYGQILSSTGNKPVEGSKVTLVNMDGKIVGRNQTKSDGAYGFRHVSGGTYPLIVSHPAHQTVEASVASVRFKPLRTVQQDLKLG